jgi:hypothetical protein
MGFIKRDAWRDEFENDKACAGDSSSWNDDEMLLVFDSGCCLHEARQYVFGGFEGAMVSWLVANLPTQDQTYVCICEYGNTHPVRINRWRR